jgi:hypothetical protein
MLITHPFFSTICFITWFGHSLFCLYSFQIRYHCPANTRYLDCFLFDAIWCVYKKTENAFDVAKLISLVRQPINEIIAM